MEKEGQIKAIGIVSIIWGFLSLVVILGLYVFWVRSSSFNMLYQAGAFHPTILVMLSLIFLTSFLYIIGGIGILKLKNWARIMLIVLSIINLLNFPIGTAISIWFLIVLFNDEVKALMK